MTEAHLRAGCRARLEVRGIAAARWRVLAVWTAASLTVNVALVGSLLWPPRPVLLWNASASTAPGLYAMGSPGSVRVGDTVVAWAPPFARRLADDRGYLPRRVPLVKRVAAVAGDRVCARRNRITVNGAGITLRRSHDPSGRPMPWWSGCERLSEGELFLLSSDRPDAFDGRYFGATRPPEVVGKARLLWPR